MSERLHDRPLPLSPSRDSKAQEVLTRFRNVAMNAVRVLVLVGATAVSEAQDTPKKSGVEQRSQSQQTKDGQWNRERIDGVLQELRRAVRKLDAEEWRMREEGSREILEIIRSHTDEMNPPPEELLEIFTDLHAKHKKGHLSLEQRIRLERVSEQSANEIRDKTDRIPPIEYEWHECLRAIEKQTGFTIQCVGISPEVLSKKIQVNRTANDCMSLLNAFGDATGTSIDFGSDTGMLVFSVQNSESKTRLFGNGKVFAIEKQNNDGIAELQLRMSPRSGALVEMEKFLDPAESKNVGIGDISVKDWVFRSTGSLPSRSKKAEIQAARKRPIAICTVVRNPQTIQIEVDGHGQKIGFQDFRAASHPEHENQILVYAHVFGNVPWPATTCAEDSKTYGAGIASQFVIRDGKGVMTSRIRACEINQRLMTFTIECEGKPTAVDVTAYQEFSMDEKVRLSMQEDENERKE